MDPDAEMTEETAAATTGSGGAAVAQVGAVGGAGFGRLDVVISNAGALHDNTLRNTTEGRAAHPGGIARRTARRFGRTAYSASKGARMVATVPTPKVDAGEPVPEAARRQGPGSPDDVAPVIVHLASKESAHITGQTIAAGGDRIALWTHPGEVEERVRPGGWTTESVGGLFAGACADRLQEFRPTPLDLAATEHA